MNDHPAIDHGKLARILEECRQARTQTEPFSSSAGLDSLSDAYLIQAEGARLRLAAGDRSLGRKIGLTSAAIQEKLGVSEPDYGTLWASRWIPVQDAQATVAHSRFLQPRVEAEFAFLIGSNLPDTEITARDVIAATRAVAAAFEIADSRIADWRISIHDTVADNASFGAFAVADWDSGLDPASLDSVLVNVIHNGQMAAEGSGKAALGHPANAVAWLVNQLRAAGEQLLPGDIVMSGAVAGMIPAAAGDSFSLQIAGRNVLSLELS